MSKQQAPRMRRARHSMHMRRSWSGCLLQMWCLCPMVSSARRSVSQSPQQSEPDLLQRWDDAAHTSVLTSEKGNRVHIGPS